MVTDSTRPSAVTAVIRASPAGDSSTSCWGPSAIGSIPDSSSTVATHSVFEPEYSGYPIASMMM